MDPWKDRSEPPGAVARPTSREARARLCGQPVPGRLGRYHGGGQPWLRDARP